MGYQGFLRSGWRVLELLVALLHGRQFLNDLVRLNGLLEGSHAHGAPR
jgi:hypothetical protein